ncbi:MAG: DUF3168 domain-containing protein [Bacteroidales bacterium]|nr:hypothetical protein [Thermodesulfovibrio thiophilus]
MITAKEALYYALSQDEELKTLLGKGNRVFSAWADTLSVLPCITFFVVSSNLERANIDRTTTLFQVDVWDKINSEKIDEIAMRIQELLHNQSIRTDTELKSFLSIVGMMREGFEGDLRRVSIDVTIHTLEV